MKKEQFSPKLDKISENIIFLLSINSRASVSDLAKTLNINRKIVENRVQRLYKNRYIKPLLIYNYPGLLKATVLIKLSCFAQKDIEAIKRLGALIKVKESLGMYDFSLLIIKKDRPGLDLFIQKINKLLHHSLQNMDVVAHDIEDTLGYKSFCGDSRFLSAYDSLQSSYTLSREDSTLIDILKDDPLMPYKELMKKTGWSYAKIRQSLSTLLRKKVIRFTVDPDYDRLDLEFHNVLAKINLAKSDEFEKYITSHPRIHWMKRGSGKWDYILSIPTRDINEFIDITREIRTANKGILFDFTALISKIHVTRKH